MYVCDHCGFESNKYFGLCQKCHQGVGAERQDVNNHSKSNNQQTSAWATDAFDWKAGSVLGRMRRVDPNEPGDEVVKSTKYEGLNAIISTGKGFVRSQVCLLGASPGVGKSTLCMSIADESTLYISSEENYSQVNQRALRVNPGAKCAIMCSTNIAEILQAIREWSGDLIIIDSLQGVEFGVGYATVARFAFEITKTIKETGKVGIIISQVTRSGEITGMNATIHVVDTVLHLERSEVTGNIIAVSSKNRFGEIGGVAVFQHQSDGFVEVDVDESNIKPEIGSTVTESRFGHKLLKISIEALAASSQAAFGIRKAVGYNTNRLVQLVGVLSYFGKMDLNKKDIYVAVGNGLYVDDVGVELAMINSILSSIYGTVRVAEATGSVKLNGHVRNGLIDGQPINHVNDLIQMYKEERNVQ